MIKKFKLYILLAAVAFSCTSCLDKMPEDAIPFDKSIPVSYTHLDVYKRQSLLFLCHIHP